MTVLLLTMFLSLVLVIGFVALFLHLSRRDRSDVSRDALLPFQDDAPPRRVSAPASIHPKRKSS